MLWTASASATRRGGSGERQHVHTSPHLGCRISVSCTARSQRDTSRATADSGGDSSSTSLNTPAPKPGKVGGREEEGGGYGAHTPLNAHVPTQTRCSTHLGSTTVLHALEGVLFCCTCLAVHTWAVHAWAAFSCCTVLVSQGHSHTPSPPSPHLRCTPPPSNQSRAARPPAAEYPQPGRGEPRHASGCSCEGGCH